MKRPIGLSLLILALLAILNAGPVLAEQAAPQSAAPVAAALAPTAQPGCGQAPDLAIALSAQGEVCPVATSQNDTVPDFFTQPAFGTRTCRCSCGEPCKTDADCGLGGICAAGITCC